LTECVVFGRSVGAHVPVASERQQHDTPKGAVPDTQEAAAVDGVPVITAEELAQHSTAEDCWVAVHGKVYDLTEFADEHPGGPESVVELAGKDGTAEFKAVHAESMLDVFEPIGIFKESN